jgi:DNA invertase Pin-like site-specific DNA recombinase
MIATESVRLPPAIASKVQPRHLERLAVIYVRQSTVQQVQDHRESTALQYALKEKAIAWGWSAQRVLVIDQDLGQSGANAEARAGFQQLLAEVSLDHVGLVLGIEMSRLARSCRDWHQLLELCALFGVLLGDADGLYDPRSYNDRLLLGLKGTLSEAELHVLRQRMNEGRLNKARRAELFNHPPIGYLRDYSGRLIIDPDQQVQSVVKLIFEKFQELGTLNALLRYLVRNQILLPIRGITAAQQGQLQWHSANRQTLRNILRHPIYAGAYTWGRREVDPRRKIPGRPATGRKVIEPEQCQVFLKDRCPAYITWEQYQQNRSRLEQNQARSQSRGAPREGSALLAGLLVCGKCGRRMVVQYGGSNRLRYCCTRGACDYAQPLCQSLCGGVLDELIEKLVLGVLEPAALELSLAAANQMQQEQDRLESHWQQRLERCRHEADRAQRQYQLAEPENRLVARELEKRWEQALLEQRKAREDYQRFLVQQPQAPSESQRREVLELARDIPALWNSPQAAAVDRKIIVRHLIERVVVSAPAERETVDLSVHWAGGYVSAHQLIRPVARYTQMREYPQLSNRIIELHTLKQTSSQIAQTLNAEGWRPPKRRKTFNAAMVRQILHRRGASPARPSSYVLKEGEWWMGDLARKLQMPETTLQRWACRGWVNARKLESENGRWLLWADEEEFNRLRRLQECPRSWDCQPQAAELTRPKAWPPT